MKNAVYIKFKLQPLRINEFNKYMLMGNDNIVCLVILEESVTYSTIWYFTNVLPSTCKTLSSHLIASEPIQEEICIDQCKDLIIHRSVKFTFLTLAFTVYFLLFFLVTVFNESRKPKCYVKSVLNKPDCYHIYFIIGICLLFF